VKKIDHLYPQKDSFLAVPAPPAPPGAPALLAVDDAPAAVGVMLLESVPENIVIEPPPELPPEPFQPKPPVPLEVETTDPVPLKVPVQYITIVPAIPVFPATDG
jgi:hypothetical protein